jgi:hypothetical protein
MTTAALRRTVVGGLRLKNTISAATAPSVAPVVLAVTVITGVVVGLTFLFGFGNVLDLALRVGVPVCHVDFARYRP